MLTMLSPEYRDNGHFVIDEKHWMSIWKFKKVYQLGDNTNATNRAESIRLSMLSQAKEFLPPAKTGFKTIKIFDVAILESFYLGR